MDDLDVRLLRSFLMVAQELSFTRAARRLFLSQQAVSSHVQSLESTLRVQLFDRTTRQVQLTPAGRVLRDQVDLALQTLDRAIGTVRRISGGGETLIMVGHTPDVAHRLLPESVGLLERIAPGLQVRSMECSEETLWSAVLSGQVDIGVGFELSPAGPGLAEQVVGREPWCVVVGPNHPLASRQRVKIVDLAQYEWLCWPRSSHPGYWNAVHSLAATLERIPPIREVWLILAYARLCRKEAVMLMPASCTPYLPKDLVALSLEASRVAGYSVVWNPNGKPAFLDLLLEAFGKAASRLT